MDGLNLSRHAQWRMANRALRREHVELIVDYGRRTRSHGATVYFMDRATRTAVRKALGVKGYAKIEHKLDAYVVVADDGTVVTAAMRQRRVHH